jgi:zinc protease
VSMTNWLRSAPAGALICGLMPAPAGAITVQQVQSPGGLQAYLVEDHTTPVVAISFGFFGGSALDPAEKLGLSGLVSSTLDEGAGDLDSFAFQSELEDRAITIRFNVDPDMARGQLTTTSANVARGIELTRLTLTQPRFDNEPVERIRRQILVSLANRSERPGYIASRKLFEVLFGNHPYARPSEGVPETIAGIERADLVDWVKSRFARDRLIIGAAGDITPEDLGRAVDFIFSDLPETTGLDPQLPEADIPVKGQTVHVLKDLPQTIVYMGQKGIKREHPDWYIATVVDYVLGGGGFASRLMEEIREKRGLAYSVSSNLAPYDAGAIITAAVGTRAEQAGESLAIIRDEWKKMHDSGPTADEVAGAKQYLTGAWPLRFTSTGSIADILLAVQRDDLGLDYLDNRNSLVEAVTVEDAKRVARELYDPNALTVVIVGPENADASSPTP